MTAATVCAPSYWRISSRCGAPVQTGHGSGWPAERRPGLGRHRRTDRAELVGLLLDRRDDLGVLVADRDVDELGGEVEVPLAVVVPEIAAFRARNRDGVDRVLHRPRVEDVALRILDDLNAELRIGLDDRHVRSLPG